MNSANNPKICVKKKSINLNLRVNNKISNLTLNCESCNLRVHSKSSNLRIGKSSNLKIYFTILFNIPDFVKVSQVLKDFA